MKHFLIGQRMKIGNIEYEDITTYEYDGSSNYSNRYFLGIKLNINDKEYEWELRLDLYNRPWEYQEQDKGNCIYCNINTHPKQMSNFNIISNIIQIKILRLCPGIKLRQPKIYRICPIIDCTKKAINTSCRRQNF